MLSYKSVKDVKDSHLRGQLGGTQEHLVPGFDAKPGENVAAWPWWTCSHQNGWGRAIFHKTGKIWKDGV